MKKLMILGMLLVGITAIAQRGERPNKKYSSDLTPEQVGTLQAKKATLALDLSVVQQEQIKKLFIENAKVRKTKMQERKALRENTESKKPTAEERYARTNERLDHQIAQKAKIKQILSDEQYAKWGKIQKRRGKQRKVKAHKSKEGKHKSRN